MQDDPAEIARRLSPAQKRALLWLRRDWRFVGLGMRPEGMPRLTERWNKPYGGMNYRLTPLGVSVRALLEQETRDAR